MRRRRSRPPARRPPSAGLFFVLFACVSSYLFSRSGDPCFTLTAMDSRSRPRDLTILMVVYNKWRYLPRSLRSIRRLRLQRGRFEVICVDDGSTDNSTAVITRFRMGGVRLTLHRLPANRGTHIARLTAVDLVQTPFLTFLDPDDEFIGNGVRAALDTIMAMNADIVEFGCRTHYANETSRTCWLPPRVRAATPARLRSLYYGGRINCHVHRKIFRTALYQAGIAQMPDYVVASRILRYEDKLHFAFLLAVMRRMYYYVKVVGEMRYWGLEDNSQSERYQSWQEQLENDRYVTWIINQTFHRIAR
jgi:glycosyltransferase involved in cell wall biosynthesis